MPRDTFAFDKSARVYDVDGRLRVEFSNITKAMVSPYWGKEIPGWESLGLDPAKIYNLLRDPVELEKAAATFSNLPLQLIHKGTTADGHDKSIVVGTVGEVEWRPPYLVANLCVWSGDGIAGIESKQQTELSCGYRYTPDMMPGAYEGVAYDGVMRDIIGNHVTLVEVGRAGSDVVVADNNPFSQGKPMKFKTAQAQTVAGALRVYLMPKLAQDAAVGGLGALLANVRAATFAKDRPALVAAINAQFGSKLAKDASLSDLDTVLASLAMDADTDKDDDEEDDPENPGQRRKKVKAAADSPEDLEGNTKGGPKANEEQAKAMDAAIKRGIAAGLATMKVELKTELAQDADAVMTARKEVEPVVGACALDSAADIYKFALDHAKVDTFGAEPSAYRALFKMHMASRTNKPQHIALDSASVKSVETRFPAISRFKHA